MIVRVRVHSSVLGRLAPSNGRLRRGARTGPKQHRACRPKSSRALFLFLLSSSDYGDQLGPISRAPSPACASAAAGSSTSPPCPTAALRRWSCTIRTASTILSPKLPQHTPTAQPQSRQPLACEWGSDGCAGWWVPPMGLPARWNIAMSVAKATIALTTMITFGPEQPTPQMLWQRGCA